MAAIKYFSRVLMCLIFILAFVFSSKAYADLNDGLVAYYPFDSNAQDATGNGHDGTVYGAILSDDRFDNPTSAYSFDGVNNYIQVNDSDSLDLSTNFSLAAWIYPTANSGDKNIFTKWGLFGMDPHRSYVLNLSNGKVTLWISIDGTDVHGVTVFYCTGSTQLTLNTWHNVVASYDGNFIRVYFDGNLDGSTPWQGNAFVGNANIKIGSDGWNANPFAGLIDDIRIYNRVLSDTEIQILFDPTDTDNDGIPNFVDNCPLLSNTSQEDTDTDNVGNACDNCISVSNPSQQDTDEDGIGDACDPCPNDFDNDKDADSICGDIDNCPNHPNGQTLGTCAKLAGGVIVGMGATCSVYEDCNEDEYCQMEQGDCNENSIGDACECYADVNCSTKVDLSDLVIMKGEFLQPCPCQADCNGDNQVNLGDLVIMKTQFLRSDCPVCAYLRCIEECENELELCLVGCESWAPDSRYICNDNCVFDYSSNCVPACD